MLFLDMTPVFASLSSFFGLDKGFEVCIDDDYAGEALLKMLKEC